MDTRRTIIGPAAIFFMTALFLLAGCAMKRDIVQLETKVDTIRSDQQQTRDVVMRLDSLLSSESDASLKLRAEIRSTIGDMIEQFRGLQASVSDLQDKVNMLSQNHSSRPVISSNLPGANAGDSAAGRTAPAVDCQALYDDSFINLRRGQYEDAIKGFGDYLKYCGTQEGAANARFWIGESYYSMEKYKEAIAEFETLLRDYSKSEKRPGALYKIARSYEELGQKKEAKAKFKTLVDDYPGTLEASQAKEKLKELK